MKELIISAAAWAAMLCIIPAAAARLPCNVCGETSAVGSAVAPREAFSLERDHLVILDRSSGEMYSVGTEEYTVYALLAQLPFIPHEEALKAQAVAARTYAVRRIMSEDKLSCGADMTNDGTKYQICLTDTQARAVYGSDYEKALFAAKKAAADTCGEILIYESSPIIAAFHTSSAGMTESAENVWGTALPYLTPASSEWDRENEYFGRVHEFTFAEISARISAEYPNAKAFDGTVRIKATPSNTVTSAELCGITLSGSRLAKLLTLESAAFTVSCGEECASFTVNGCGNLAGMSICGADSMAKSGADYREILAHYYSGTELCYIIAH